MDVHIHKARAYVEAPGIDHPGLRFPQIASDDGQLAVLDENIHHAADPPTGSTRRPLPDEQLHFVAPFPRSFFLLVYIKERDRFPVPSGLTNCRYIISYRAFFSNGFSPFPDTITSYRRKEEEKQMEHHHTLHQYWYWHGRRRRGHGGPRPRQKTLKATAKKAVRAMEDVAENVTQTLGMYYGRTVLTGGRSLSLWDPSGHKGPAPHKNAGRVLSVRGETAWAEGSPASVPRR